MQCKSKNINAFTFFLTDSLKPIGPITKNLTVLTNLRRKKLDLSYYNLNMQKINFICQLGQLANKNCIQVTKLYKDTYEEEVKNHQSIQKGNFNNPGVAGVVLQIASLTNWFIN